MSAGALCDDRPRPLVRGARGPQAIPRYEDVAADLAGMRDHLALDLAALLSTLEAAFGAARLDGRAAITGRIKSAPATWIKMHRYGVGVDDVHDLLGVRVVVASLRDCRIAAAVVRGLWPGGCVSVRDYIAQPKATGYRSLHLCMRTPGHAPFEVQIRTREMDAECRDGAANHELHKAAVWRSFMATWGKTVSRESG